VFRLALVIIFVQIIVISSCWESAFVLKSSYCKKCLRRVIEIRFPFVVPSCDRCPESACFSDVSASFQIALWTYTAFILLASKNCWPGVTPWSRVLLEKLTGLQLVKKFPAFYRT